MIDVLFASVSAIAGMASIAKTIINHRKKGQDQSIFIQLSGKERERVKIPADIPMEDLKKLIERLNQIDNIETALSSPKPKDQAGFVVSDFFLYLVPGFIALLFAGTFVYLLVLNRQNPNYATPKELSSAMTMIIGYFFGVGVSSVANKSKSLNMEEIKKLISGKG
jgi:hypothetical protein